MEASYVVEYADGSMAEMLGAAPHQWVPRAWVEWKPTKAKAKLKSSAGRRRNAAVDILA